MRGQADWPNLDAVSIKLPMKWTLDLMPDELGILFRLVEFIAARAVNTYTEADPDPRLMDDDMRLRNIARCSKRQWTAFKRRMTDFFVYSEGSWRLREDDVIRISRPLAREAISVAVKSIVLARDGHRCAYCGTVEGPFHYDHLFPVSRGGTDHPTNLVLACMSCNMAKGSKTLREWVGK